MPSHRRGQKLAFSFDEDELSLAWDAVRAAALPAGTPVHGVGLVLPPWFLAGLGLTAAADAAWLVEAVPTTVGPGVVVRPAGAAPDVEPQARAFHAQRPQRPEADWQRHRVAREGPDTEADFPLGAYVLPARHEAVTTDRMRLSAGTVRSFTAIGAGAAPTEFARLQDAVGAYHVVLVESDGARTVGIWAGDSAPKTGDRAVPCLRRLFRTQGAWRHGVKFAPA